MAVNLAELIHRGGVFDNVSGSKPEEIFKAVTEKLHFSAGLSSDVIYNALCAREKIMSTAVGNGIALPHARIPVIQYEGDQRVCVIYLKNPIEMSAPDDRKVFVMFMILSQNQQAHLKVLSEIVELMKKAQFRKLLEKHAGEAELLNSILNLS